MGISTIGIDIGKNSFHFVALDARGAIVVRRQCSRTQLILALANLRPCLVGMSAFIITRSLTAWDGLTSLEARAHPNVAGVALANKLVRRPGLSCSETPTTTGGSSRMRDVVASGDRALATVMHTDFCEYLSPMIEQSTGGVRNLVRKARCLPVTNLPPLLSGRRAVETRAHSRG